MSLVQEGTLVGFVSFAVLDRGEEESFEGDSSCFFVLELISFAILSVLESINSLNPCKSTPCSISFFISSFSDFKMGFILLWNYFQFSLRMLGTSISLVQAASQCST